MMEAVGLTPTHHILLSTAGTKGQKTEEAASPQPGCAHEWAVQCCLPAGRVPAFGDVPRYIVLAKRFPRWGG